MDKVAPHRSAVTVVHLAALVPAAVVLLVTPFPRAGLADPAINVRIVDHLERI